MQVSTTPIERYLGLLDDGEFEAAAAVFTEDAVYARPGFQPGPDGGRPTFGGMVVLRGRGAILDSFRQRGVQPYRHRVLAAGASGDRCFVEMTLRDYGTPVEALAVAELDGPLIRRYVALTASLDPDAAAGLLPGDG